MPPKGTAMASADRPNILFFFTDDQRFDTIHALGNEQVRTPTMDRLVGAGTTFTHAHIPGGTSGAVCMPSRAMLHTGRTLFHLEGAGQSVPAEHALLGETLREAGYRTFGTGKWHNGREAFARSFTDGAEIFFGGMTDHWNVPAYDYDPTGAYENRLPACNDAFRSNELSWRGCDHIAAGVHSTDLLADAAVEFLEGYEDEKPFFLYVSFLAPHDPRTMPEKYRAMYDPETIELPPNFLGGHPFDNGELHIRDEMLAAFPRTPEEVRRHIAEYYAMITHVDDQLGRVLEVLEATGRLENTIIVLAGDNGLAVGQHGLMGKQSNYDHSVRVPLILAGPGIPQNERRDAFAYLFDLFPTLCELTGVEVPVSVEGRSLVPVLQDAAAPLRETVFCAYTDKHRSVRNRRFKLIEYVVNGGRRTQLFDLQSDPWELVNLAHDPGYAEPLAELRQEMVRWRDDWDDAESQWGKVFWETCEL
jgi:arylsulfatase A-like enzyme